MFCENCGNRIEDNAAFCPYCGTKVQELPPEYLSARAGTPADAATEAELPTGQQPLEQTQSFQPQQPATDGTFELPAPQYPAPDAYAPQPYAPPARNNYGQSAPPRSPLMGGRAISPTLDAVHRMLRSPAFLIGSIAMSLVLIFSLIAGFSASTFQLDYRTLRDLVPGLDYRDFQEIQNGLSLFSGAGIAATVVGMIPTILLVIGLWLTYAAAAGRRNPMPTAGLSMVKGVFIYQLVMICIAIGLILLFLLLFLVVGGALSGELSKAFGSAASQYSGAYGSNDTDFSIIASLALPILLVTILLFVGVFVMLILFYAKLIKTVNTVKKTIRTDEPSDQVSPFVAVLWFLSAFFSLFPAVLSFVIPQFSVLTGRMVFAGLGSFCAIVAQVCFGVLIFQYRSEMRALMNAQRTTF